MSRFGFGFGFGASFGSGGGGFPLGSSNFVTIWNTENLGGSGSATKVILLPMAAGVEVDWGDGTVNNLNTHTYAVSGIKTITIDPPVTGFGFNNGQDKLKLIEVVSAGGLVMDGESKFFGCSNMVWSATDTPTITTLNFANMFRDCTLANPPIGNWDFSAVTGMFAMFFNATAFDQDISMLNIGQVTNMGLMLNGSGLSTVNYSNYLISLDGQSMQPNVVLSASGVNYNSTAVAARANLLLTPKFMTITDAGLV